jgi:hypothetical protein
MNNLDSFHNISTGYRKNYMLPSNYSNTHFFGDILSSSVTGLMTSLKIIVRNSQVLAESL